MKANQGFKFMQSVSDPNTLELYIYGAIQGDSYDWWSGETKQSETSAEYFKQKLSEFSHVSNIVLYINSNGGSVYEAMAIRNQLMRHKATVSAYVDGFAASAASFILTGCDNVKMYSNTMQMLHNMWNVAVGNANALRKSADDLDEIMKGNRQAYLEKSAGKLTEEKLIEILDGETWLTAEQCFEYGLCDEIISEAVDLTKAKQLINQFDKSLEQHIEYSKNLYAEYEGMQLYKAEARQPEKQPDEDPEKLPDEQLGEVMMTNAKRLMMAFNPKSMEE